MGKRIRGLLVLVFSVTCAAPAPGGTLKCPPDSVKVGNACIDLYEASVWQIDPSNTKLVKKVQSGKVTLADLTDGGATRLSSSPSCLPDFPANFPNDGNWTPVLGSSPPSPGVYAVSIPGVKPSACITWFQANQACALSGKRLIRNGEWQRAAAGTPDPGNADDGSTTCATNSAGPANTGSRSACKSSWGVFDMVGNVWEYVEDWADRAQNCTDWTSQTGTAGGDDSCFGGPGDSGGNASRSIPGAVFRGGSWSDGSRAGVFAVDSTTTPAITVAAVRFGFRCAR